MKPHILLHIGTEKTGTTSIQTFLAMNRGPLAERGVLVPTAMGHRNHLGLTGYAQDDATLDDVRISHGVKSRDEVPAFRAGLQAALAGQMGPAERVVFTGEHMSSRLRTQPEIARLRALLEPYASGFTVLVWLRDQPAFLASWYATSVKSGNTGPLAWPPGRAVSEMMDYRKLLGDWVAVFGREAMRVRRFVAADFPGGDLIEDFCAAAGIPGEGLRRPERKNEALDLDCLAFLRAFNVHVPRIEERQMNPWRKPIVALMEELSTGPAYRLQAEMAGQVRARYAEPNAWVAAQYFPHREQPLFPAAPVVAATSESAGTPESFARLAAGLWKHNLGRIRQLEEKVVRLGGKVTAY